MMWMNLETTDLMNSKLEFKEQIKMIDNTIKDHLSKMNVEYKYPEKYSCSRKNLKKKNSDEPSCPVGISRMIIIDDREYMLSFSYSSSFSHNVGVRNEYGIYEMSACTNYKGMFKKLDELIKQNKNYYIIEKIDSLKQQIHDLEKLIV